MTCKYCGNGMPLDSIYCNFCGKKVKYKKSTRSFILKISATFILFVFIISSTYYLISINAIDRVRDFFTDGVTAQVERIISDDGILNPGSTTIGTTIPSLREEINIEHGFSYTEIFLDRFYFIDSQNNFVMAVSYDAAEAEPIFERETISFFISDDIFYFLCEDGIYVLNDDEITKIINVDGISSFYINANYIFYSVADAESGTLNLYRTNLSGEYNNQLLTGITEFIIDERNRTIYYVTVVDSYDYDADNMNSRFVTLNERVDYSDYLTIFLCNFLGEANLKIAETAVNYYLNFSGLTLFDNSLAFMANEAHRTNLYIVDLIDSTYVKVDNAETFHIFDNRVYFTRTEEYTPYIMNLYFFDFVEFTETHITNLLEFTSLHMHENVIYILIANQFLMRYDISSNTKMALFDFSKHNLFYINQITNVTDNYIYFSNAILRKDMQELFYINKSALQVLNINIGNPNVYREADASTEAYFNYLVSRENLAGDLSFAIVELANNSTPKLLVGRRSPYVTNASFYSGVSETAVYTFWGEVMRLETDENFMLDAESSIKRLEQGRLLTFSSVGTEYHISLGEVTNDVFITTPILKHDRTEEGDIFYRFEDDEYFEITSAEYNSILLDLERDARFLIKHDVTLTNILRGLYFN